MKPFFLTLALAVVATLAVALPPIETLKIKTSAKCDMCKERIEKNLTLTKGVKEAVLDLDTKVVTISYNPKKVKPADLKSVIIKSGYDADDLIADDKAHDKLPECCQKGSAAHGHMNH